MTISPLWLVFAVFSWTEVLFSKMSSNFLPFFSAQCEWVSVLPHFCFSEYFLQTPVSIKKVEMFKFSTFAFALVVVNHTNVAPHLLFFLCWCLHWTWRHHLSLMSFSPYFLLVFHGCIPNVVQQLLLFVRSISFMYFLFWWRHQCSHLEANTRTVLRSSWWCLGHSSSPHNSVTFCLF